jgi:hypothetical protein
VILCARDPHAGDSLRKLLEPAFGTVIDSSFRGTFLLASREQWADARLAALRKACGRAATVVVPQEYDTGN